MLLPLLAALQLTLAHVCTPSADAAAALWLLLMLPLLLQDTCAPSRCRRCCWMHARLLAAIAAGCMRALLLLLMPPLPLRMHMTFHWPSVHVYHPVLVSLLSVCSTLPVKA